MSTWRWALNQTYTMLVSFQIYKPQQSPAGLSKDVPLQTPNIWKNSKFVEWGFDQYPLQHKLVYYFIPLTCTMQHLFRPTYRVQRHTGAKRPPSTVEKIRVYVWFLESWPPGNRKQNQINRPSCLDLEYGKNDSAQIQSNPDKFLASVLCLSEDFIRTRTLSGLTFS